MGVAEIITMSLSFISSFLCSEKAMRVRPDMVSPWLPVVMTTISSSLYLSRSSIDMSLPSGISRSPSCMATLLTLTMERPHRHTLRLCRTAESTTCCMRCMLEANMAIMMRPCASWNRFSNVAPTVRSLMV